MTEEAILTPCRTSGCTSGNGPKSALFFLTYRCNLRCDFCLSFNGYWQPDPSIRADVAISPSAFLKPNRQSTEVTLDQIERRILPQIVNAGVTHLALSGGEVLARKDIQGIFEAIARTPLSWCFDSNLMLLTQETADVIRRTGCDTVFVSVDGPRDTHNKLRGSDTAFEKTKRGIERLRAAREPDTNPKIVLNCVVQPGNEAELEQMVDVAMDLGVDQLAFQLLSKLHYDQPFDAACAHAGLANARLRAPDFVSEYPLEKIDKDSLQAWFSNTDNRTDIECDYVNESFRIDPEGFVIPCVEHRMGNLLTQNLQEIWRGGPYGEFREALKREGPLDACRRCCNVVH